MIGLKVAFTAFVVFVFVVIMVNMQAPKRLGTQAMIGGIVLLCLLTIAGGLIAAAWGV